jgi:STE24 endopeptidase
VSRIALHPIEDPVRREQARRYARLRRRLFFLDLALSAGVLALLLITGAAVGLRELVQGLVPAYLGQVALFVIVLALGYAVLILPLSYVRGFMLPHRYGLSVQSHSGWLGDFVTGVAIDLVQSVALGVAVYALLRYAPDRWWLWAGVVVIGFVVVMTLLAPVLIVPVFFKLVPLSDEDLRWRLLALAARAGTRVRGVFVIDMSRRTRTANAALMGIGRTRRIVLGDTLWQRFTPDEIEAVLAHELGHHVHHDLWRGIALDAGLTFAGLWLLDRLIRVLAGPLGLSGIEDVAGLPLLLLVAGALFTALLPVTNGFSRRREAAADRFAVRATHNPDAWRSALRKLADQNLDEVDPPRWVEWLLYSHPSTRRRLEATHQVLH